MAQKASIMFCGGTGTVTGANFLLDAGDTKILVDCGAFQREHVCDPANVAPFPYDPTTISALVVTHAHQDHIGRIPQLVRAGFRGAIHSTAATMDLASVMLDDALSVMQTEAEKHGCQVLYDENDIEQTFRQWQGHGYHEPFHLGNATLHASSSASLRGPADSSAVRSSTSPESASPRLAAEAPEGLHGNIMVELLDAGHVLGSAMARFTRNGRTVLFTGDLGNTPEPLLNDTESPVGADYIIMESVYGDRVHEGREERVERLRAAVEGARARHGTLLIPSFSLERTQVLLFELNAMIEGGKMQPISIYLDAPLAIRVTEIFKRYIDYMNPAVRELTEAGDDPFVFPGLSITRNTGESRAIHSAADPKVIIAGAGMSSGGRIRSHEKQYLPDKKAAVLFVGYQSPGSLGRRIQEGASQVEIDGDRVRVHAQIDTLSGFSGHADRDQLLNFVEDAGEKITRVFVTMGEPKASAFLAQRIRDFLDVDAIVPEAGQSFDIEW